jgi:hypothetical protein
MKFSITGQERGRVFNNEHNSHPKVSVRQHLSYSWVAHLTSVNNLFVSNDLRREVVFRFVDIGGIVDHQCSLNDLFFIYIRDCLEKSIFTINLCLNVKMVKSLMFTYIYISFLTLWQLPLEMGRNHQPNQNIYFNSVDGKDTMKSK